MTDKDFEGRSAPDLLAQVKRRLDLARQHMTGHRESDDRLDFGVDPLFNDAGEFGAAIQAVLEMHKPFGIYSEECGHDHELNDDGTVPEGVLDVPDVGLVCQAGLQYRICTHCCVGGWDDQREYCADEHDHHQLGVYCPTVQAIAEKLLAEVHS